MSPRRGGAGIELVWPGKYDAQGRRVRAEPRPIAWCVRERHGTDEGDADALVHGDNLDVLGELTSRIRGQVDLVYMDPPFSTGGAFSVAQRIGAGDRWFHAPAYDDGWPGGPAEFLAMLAPRLEHVHELLAPHGSLYVHIDPTIGHAVKLLIDEIFGAASFQREIVWRIGWVSGFKTRARNWIRNHDTILFYVKDPAKLRFHKVWVPHPPGYQRRAGAPARAPGIAVDDVWNAGPADLALSGAESLDSIQIKSFSREKTGYATQKNESLLRRILAASSAPGELVVDPFCGSGTTLAVAQAMGRRFIGCDVGRAAIRLARARVIAGVGARAVEIVEARGEGAGAGVRARAGTRARGRAGAGTRAGRVAGDVEGVRGRVVTEVVGRVGDAARVHVVDGLVDAEGLASSGVERDALVVAPAFELALAVARVDGELRVGPWAAARGRRGAGGLRLLRLAADVLAHPQAELSHALVEVPRIVIAVREQGDQLALALVEYAFVDLDWLPDDLRALAPGPAELVDELAIDGARRDGVLRPAIVRRRGEPQVATLAVPPRAKRLAPTLQLLDVRQLCVRIELELARTRTGWDATSARMSVR